MCPWLVSRTLQHQFFQPPVRTVMLMTVDRWRPPGPASHLGPGLWDSRRVETLIASPGNTINVQLISLAARPGLCVRSGRTFPPAFAEAVPFFHNPLFCLDVALQAATGAAAAHMQAHAALQLRGSLQRFPAVPPPPPPPLCVPEHLPVRPPLPPRRAVFVSARIRSRAAPPVML